MIRTILFMLGFPIKEKFSNVQTSNITITILVDFSNLQESGEKKKSYLIFRIS